MAETEAQMMVELNKHLGEFRVNLARRFEEQKLHSQYMENQMLEMKEILISMAERARVQSSSSKVPTQNNPATPVSHAAHQVFDETPKSANTIEIDDTESMEQEESIRDEPIVVDELLHQVALQVLDEMPEFTDEIDLEIAHQVLDEMSEPKEFHNHDRSTEEVLEIDSDLNHDLAALQVLEEMPHSTKTIEVDLIGVLTKDDDDDDLLEMASWIEEDCEPPTYAKGYMRLMCFDPGGEEHKNLKVFECAVDADTVVTSADAERGEENGVHSDEAYEGDETIADEMVNEKLDLLHISDANTSSEVLYVTKDGDMTEANSMSLSSTVVYLEIKIMVDDSCLIVVDNMSLVFDPGGVVDHGRYRFDSSYAAGLVHTWSELVW